MSTYTLGFVVGDFDCIETKLPGENTLIRVFTCKGKSERGRFALQHAAKLLPYYTKYYGAKYPLPKLDLMAISDFPIGIILSCSSFNFAFVSKRKLFNLQLMLWSAGD